jgi:acyl carrier protein
MPTISPDIGLFIKKFEDQFQHAVPGGVKPATRFRDLEEWTSLQALIIISSFDWDYGVTVAADELRKAITVEDLFNLVIKKLKL